MCFYPERGRGGGLHSLPTTTLCFLYVLLVFVVFLINKLESLFFTNERVLKRLLLNVCMLKVESEENDASRCDSTHYENISLLCVIRKKKILSKLSFVCLKKTEESFLLSFLMQQRKKEGFVVSVVFLLLNDSKYIFFSSVCLSVKT